jgi:hypothetical protein
VPGAQDASSGGAGDDGAPMHAPASSRFQVPHRGGTRVEVGEAVRLPDVAERPWICAVKLVGRKRDDGSDADPTQTLLLRTGRGETAEDARRDALAQLTLVYGSPVEPPPVPVIVQMPSDPPPRPRPGFFARLLARFTR